MVEEVKKEGGGVLEEVAGAPGVSGFLLGAVVKAASLAILMAENGIPWRRLGDPPKDGSREAFLEREESFDMALGRLTDLGLTPEEDAKAVTDALVRLAGRVGANQVAMRSLRARLAPKGEVLGG